MTTSAVSLLLHGGLGNQLFQYAAAIGVLDDYPASRPRVFSYGSEWGPQHPDLRSLLGVKIQYPNRLHRSVTPGLDVRESWKDRVSTLSAKAVAAIQRTQLIRQSDPYARRPETLGHRCVLEGFFQHPDWWMPAWRQLATEIHHREPASLAELRSEHRNVIKLRRSDYAGRGIVLTDDYYRRAIAALELQGERITVISEDAEAARSFAGLLAEFDCIVQAPEQITGDPNIDDFWHLAAARVHIMANSSYSWWAGAVATVVDPRARIAYPQPWLPNSWSQADIPDVGIGDWLGVPADFE